MHRVVMENTLGRPLCDGEDVHHKNEDKTDNRPENLEVLSKSEHTKRHVSKKMFVRLTCPNCSKGFEVAPRFYKQRKKRNKSGEIFCSRTCGASV